MRDSACRPPTPTSRAPCSDAARSAARRFVERVGVVDDNRELRDRVAPRRQLELHRFVRRHARARRFDRRDRAPFDAERPCDPACERRPPRARGPFDGERFARPERARRGREPFGGRFEADDGPRRIRARLRDAGRREPRRLPQRARELVDARVTIVRRVVGRARGDLCERDPLAVVHLPTAPREPFAERRAERVHLGAHRDRLPREQLRRGVFRREPLRARPSVAPRSGEPEIDERAAPPFADDDVRRLEIAVKQARAMDRRQLIARARQRLEPVVLRLFQNVVEAFAHDELAHHVPPPARAERPERDDLRDAEPFETGERHRLAHEREHLRFTAPSLRILSASVRSPSLSRTAQTSPPPPCPRHSIGSYRGGSSSIRP